MTTTLRGATTNLYTTWEHGVALNNKTSDGSLATMSTTLQSSLSSSEDSTLPQQQQEQQELLLTLLQQHLPDPSVLDQWALEISLQFLQDHAMEVACGMVPLPMHVFALMPLRHANTISTLTQVQQDIEQNMAPLQPQMQALIQRFRKATNRRMALLQDEARRCQRQEQVSSKITTTTTPTATTTSITATQGSSNNKSQKNIHDQDNNKNVISNTNGKSDHNMRIANLVNNEDDDDDILEHVYFEADMSHSHQHAVHKAMVQFLANRNIGPLGQCDSGTTNRQHGSKGMPEILVTKDGDFGPAMSSTTTAATTTTTNVAVPLIVSLSGGVDSMVVATVLAHLRDNCNYSHLRLAAVHIDYANRPESGAEADYCARYCQQRGFAFTCRRIEEVTRGITARDEYERRAREIRFQEYRNAISKERQQVAEVLSTNSSSINNKVRVGNDLVCGVVLGHHRGDLRENVLSNAHKGCGPLDLSGMTEVSLNDGVTIYRPLLGLEKSSIFDYAHKFGVPYFKDTTPHWSTRGKLRNKLLPLLEEIYGEGSMNNLSALANESDEARALLYQTVVGPFLNQVARKPMGIYFDTVPWKLQGLYFWKLVLREVLHNAGLGMFKEKSVASFFERIQATKLRAGWLQCRRDYAVYLKGDGRVFVFYPESFPWRKEDAFSSVVGRGKNRQWKKKCQV
jgi:tRNA(Ile)-lysidine synthetase-like protein